MAAWVLVAGGMMGCVGWSRASGTLFPPAHALFDPLIADPRELQFSLRMVTPVAGKNLGEAAMGDYLGVYQWNGSRRVKIQWGVGGGAFGRFNLSTTTNDLQVVDFYGNVPIDWAWGRWSSRFMIFHTSSHLGDDYLSGSREVLLKHSWDSLRWLAALRPVPSVRLYGGPYYVFRSLPKDDRLAWQSGVEWVLPKKWKNHFQPFFAADFQSWERNAWNPSLNVQAGLTLAGDTPSRRGISLVGGYFTGPRPHGQFYPEKESSWFFGLRFDLTN